MLSYRRIVRALVLGVLTAALPAGSTPAAAAAYDGRLYDANAQVGDGTAPVEVLGDDMRRNLVSDSLMFFTLDPDDFADDADYLSRMIRALPCRVVPFFGMGWGAEETVPGDELTGSYRTSLRKAKRDLGRHIVKGFGELDMYGWDGGSGVSPDDPRVESLIQLASDNGLTVMLHPQAGDTAALGSLLAAFPDTTFLAHQFAGEFSLDRDTWLTLMGTYPNLYFIVTADHMLFDDQSSPPIGLLYKYQDLRVDRAVRRFVPYYRENADRLLQDALDRYRTAIETYPSRFLWGSEAGTRYAYRPEVYDRWVSFSRRFIGRLDPDAQERFARRNAAGVLGSGVRCG